MQGVRCRTVEEGQGRAEQGRGKHNTAGLERAFRAGQGRVKQGTAERGRFECASEGEQGRTGGCKSEEGRAGREGGHSAG